MTTINVAETPLTKFVRKGADALRAVASPGKKRFVLAFIAEVVCTTGMFLVLRLAARYWGPFGFGEYVTARRIIGVTQLLVQCGAVLALTRYVAMARANTERPRPTPLFFGGIAIVVATSTIAIVAMHVAPTWFSNLFFGTAELGGIVRSMSFALPGGAIHALACGYFWGRMQVLRAGSLQVANLVIVPSLIMLAPGLDVSSAIFWMAIGWFLVALAFAFDVVRQELFAIPSINDAREAAGHLLQYGIPRIPGEIVLGLFLSLPQTLTAHTSGIDRAGFVGLGLSFLLLAVAPSATLGQLLLPTVSALQSSRDQKQVRRLIGLSILFGVSGTGMLCVFVYLASPWIVRVFLGTDYLPAIPDIRMICFAGIGYTLYVSMRGVLDALYVFPYNALNIAVATALLFGLTWVIPPTQSFVIAATLLGVLSCTFALRRRETIQVAVPEAQEGDCSRKNTKAASIAA